MPENLDLSVPDVDGRSRKPRGGGGGAVTLLLVILVLLTAAIVYLQLRGAPATVTPGPASADAEKALALKLEERDLHNAAIDAWEGYLSGADLSGEAKAKIYWRLGNLYARAERYEEAVGAYYRCEAAHRLPDIENELPRKVKRCLEALGRFSAVGRELSERTTGAPSGAENVVAEIGQQKITLADLEAEIEQEADTALQASPYAVGEAGKSMREQILKRMSTMDAKNQLLNRMVIEEVLYRKAMEKGLAKDADFRRLVSRLEKRLLAGKVIEREMEKEIRIGESDLRNYYGAHKSLYVEPESAEIAHILVKTKEEAKEALAGIEKGAKFEDLAGKISVDEATAKEGGKIPGRATKGGYIPVVGEAENVSELVFSTGEGKVLSEPVETKKGFHVVKVLKRIPERQMSFEEVKDRVSRSLYVQKRQEVQNRLFAALREKYDVVMHPSKISVEVKGKKE